MRTLHGFYAALLLWLATLPAHAAVTPTEVFVEAKALKNALAATVTREIGVELLPLIDMGLDGAKPHHVYALGAALNHKIGVYLTAKGGAGFERPAYPRQQVTPGDVRELLFAAQRNLQRAVPGLQLQRETAADKVPADVMREITYANLWLDLLLAGKAGPQYPYWTLEVIDHELERLALHAGEYTGSAAPRTLPKVTPADVFDNAVNFYRSLALFDRLHFDATSPVHPYDIASSGAKVTPVHVYTLSLFNLYYLYAVELKQGLTPDSAFDPPLQAGIKPNDVFREYERNHYHLLRLVANLGDE